VTALVYIAVAAFAIAIKKAGWFKPAACNSYLVISLLLFLLDVLPLTAKFIQFFGAHARPCVLTHFFKRKAH
jgi:hypothetical protein